MRIPATSQRNVSLYKKLRERGTPSAKPGHLALVGVLERLAGGYTCDDDPVEIETRCVLDNDDGIWAISDIYWRLRTAESGVTHGLVFTPPGLTDLVVNQLADSLPVVDLGAGTGMLSITAAKRGYQVTAVERDPEMATVLTCLAAIEGVGDRINVVTGDAFNYSRESPSQIMANPPYTRHHSLSNGDKRDLLKLSRSVGMSLRRTAGHYAYFMLYAWTVPWSQREVLLIPTNWLETQYGRPLREYLSEEKKYSIWLVGYDNGRSAFRHALTTSCIVTSSNKLEEPSTKLQASNSEYSPPGSTNSNNKVKLVPNVRLLRNGQQEQVGVTLDSILRVRRGIATGANELFVISQDDNDHLAFPAEELVPIVRRLREYDNRADGSFLWVPNSKPSEPSLNRIRDGEERMLHRRALCMSRNPWWRISIPKEPTYLLSYMGRRRPTILRNHRKLLNLNNIHGVDPVDGVSREIVDAVVDWLASTDGQNSMLECARRYQGGLWKLEPGDLHRIVLPQVLVRYLNVKGLEDSLNLNGRTVIGHLARQDGTVRELYNDKNARIVVQRHVGLTRH